MKRNLIGFMIWVVVYVISMVVNLGSFWMGDSADSGQLGLTVLYSTVVLMLLCLVRNSRRWMKHAVIWGIIAVAAGLLCQLARAGIAWAAIPALMLGGTLFTPFYGLTYLVLLEDWDVFYGAMLSLSVLWTAASTVLLWRLKQREKNE